jgi:hypothetical protein
MSWHASVIGCGDHAMPDGCVGAGTAFWSPLTAPASLANRRGSLTIAAFCGAASGTLMTSIRHFEGLAPVGVFVLLPSQPAIWAAVRTVDVPET